MTTPTTTTTSDGPPPPPRRSWSQSFLLTAWEAFLCLAVPILALAFWKLPWPWAGLPLALWLVPTLTPYHQFTPFIRFLNWVRKSYGCELVNTNPLPTGPFVMGVHPHGYAPFVLSYHLAHPLLRHIYLAQHSFGSLFPTPGFMAMLTGNIVIANKYDLMAALQDGHPVAILPGGLKEMALAEPGSPTIDLVRHHTGFIKLAWDMNIPLVPCWAFGLQDHYRPLLPICKHAIKVLGYPFPAFRPSSLFHTAPNAMITGRPLDPSDYMSMDALTMAYFNAIEGLFNKHKAQYNEEGREIRWVETRASLAGAQASTTTATIYDPLLSPKAPSAAARFSPDDPANSPRGWHPSASFSTAATTTTTTTTPRRRTTTTGARPNSIQTKEILMVLFLTLSFVLAWRSTGGQWWGFHRMTWMPTIASPWVVAHVVTATLWVVLGAYQQGPASRRYHRPVGILAVVAILICMFTGFGLSFLDHDSTKHDPTASFIKGVGNLGFGSYCLMYLHQGLQGLYHHQYKTTHGKNLKILYNLLYLGLLPRFMALFLRYLAGYSADTSIAISMLLTLVVLLSTVAHSYSLRPTMLPKAYSSLTLSITIEALAVTGCLGHGQRGALMISVVASLTTLLVSQALSRPAPAKRSITPRSTFFPPTTTTTTTATAPSAPATPTTAPTSPTTTPTITNRKTGRKLAPIIVDRDQPKLDAF